MRSCETVLMVELLRCDRWEDAAKWKLVLSLLTSGGSGWEGLEVAQALTSRGTALPWFEDELWCW